MVKVICTIMAVIIGATLVFGVIFVGYETVHYMMSAGYPIGEAIRTGWEDLMKFVGIKKAGAEASGVIEFPFTNVAISWNTSIDW